MRLSDSLQVLLRVRCQKAEVEERKLLALYKELKLANAELASLSTELEQIASTRLKDIHCISPNTHHQVLESQSKILWQKCADQAAEIGRLKEAQARQMSTYMSAHREREVVANLYKQQSDALKAEKDRHEQKLNEDLFHARKVAKWDI